jgi:hypothetical protein
LASYDALENYIALECAGSAAAMVVKALELLSYLCEGEVDCEASMDYQLALPLQGRWVAPFSTRRASAAEIRIDCFGHRVHRLSERFLRVAFASRPHYVRQGLLP